LKIAHVIPSLARSTGGPSVMVVDVARAVRSYGADVTVYATSQAGPARTAGARRATQGDLPAGIDALDVRLYPVRPPYRLAFSPALYQALGSEIASYDVVHIHSLFLFPQFAAYRQALRADVPYVVSQHGALDDYLRKRGRLRKWLTDAVWQRSMLEHAAGLHVGSAGEAAVIADIAPSVPRVTAPFGIHFREFEKLPPGSVFRERFGIEGNAPLVVNVGRITEKKGLDILVRATALVRRRIENVRLALVGPDDEALGDSLQTLAEKEGIGGDIVFTGMLRGEDRLSALAAADAWALPSHTEAFPMAVLEALAAGAPSVITPAVNNARDIEAAGAAVLCEPDPEAVADGLLSILSDQSRAAELSRRARSFARRFDWQQIVA
jgi:glycosyltransferase involved in cell wall biosynthesis